jgi:hypothetical protein
LIAAFTTTSTKEKHEHGHLEKKNNNMDIYKRKTLTTISTENLFL